MVVCWLSFRHQTTENKEILRQLVDKWSRDIFGKNSKFQPRPEQRAARRQAPAPGNGGKYVHGVRMQVPPTTHTLPQDHQEEDVVVGRHQRIGVPVRCTCRFVLALHLLTTVLFPMSCCPRDAAKEERPSMHARIPAQATFDFTRAPKSRVRLADGFRAPVFVTGCVAQVEAAAKSRGPDPKSLKVKLQRKLQVRHASRLGCSHWLPIHRCWLVHTELHRIFAAR